MSLNPILAEVLRKNIVESCHRGSALVVNTLGETVFSLGDTNRLIYPRSSLKFFQAIPLVESGAADHFGLSKKELALACASHNAEENHVATISNWLDRIGLNGDDLECGHDLPLLARAAHQLIARGETPGRIHQNCSGKHTGMLTYAKYLEEETRGYSEYGHPVQRHWMKTFSELIDIDVNTLDWERDGCGMPAICMPMERLAFGFAQFANFENIKEKRANAMSRILDAVRNYPEMIAGSDRCCTAVIKETEGAVIVKTGAEAVYGGVIPKMKLGFVLKIDDGASRASEVALGGLLHVIKAISSEEEKSLRTYFEPSIYNTQKKLTGRIRPSENWKM
ncbi:MAG: asparaginase [Gammaproteobacteria bacterium]|nr:asparaginase [Gammaproteobacteria bacterium]